MRPGDIVTRLSAMGASAQATVPGLYAWGVTVAPAAWSRGASIVAKIAASVAVLALVAGIAAERRWGTGARIGTLWAFVVSCGLAWSAAPAGLAPLHVDVQRGLAGMLGWGLFALASAAPALRAPRAPGRVVTDEAGLVPRSRLQRGDMIYVVAGGLSAVALQFLGWGVAGTERALLVRLVAVVAGLVLIGACVDVATARHVPRAPYAWPRRLRHGTLPLVVALLLLGAGAFFVFRR